MPSADLSIPQYEAAELETAVPFCEHCEVKTRETVQCNQLHEVSPDHGIKLIPGGALQGPGTSSTATVAPGLSKSIRDLACMRIHY